MEDKPTTVSHRRVRVNIGFMAIVYEDDTNEALAEELQAGVEDFFAGDVHDIKVTVENMA